MDTRIPPSSLAAATVFTFGGRGACAARRTSPAQAQTAAAVAMNRVLVSDMSQPSERLPQGVPTWYDWANHPRVNPVASPRKFRAFTQPVGPALPVRRDISGSW